MITRNSQLARGAFLIAVAFLFSVGCSAPELLDCNDPAREKEHKLKIKLKADDSPDKVVYESSDAPADEIHVCRGDVVRWKQNKKDFKIGFKDDSDRDGDIDANDSPFAWSEDNSDSNREVFGTVRTDAVEEVRYKYTVTIPATPDPELDPIIIVDR
jgi:hypothetical protein